MSNTEINGGGMPSDFTSGSPARMIDGAYKSNNGNLDKQPTSTVFDPNAAGIGSFNKHSPLTGTKPMFSK
jgi:hypothetical protein